MLLAPKGPKVLPDPLDLLDPPELLEQRVLLALKVPKVSPGPLGLPDPLAPLGQPVPLALQESPAVRPLLKWGLSPQELLAQTRK